MVRGLSRFSIEKMSIDKLMTKQNKKLISKIYKKILKQIDNKPIQNWFEINSNDYSLKEMKIIKRYFCDYLGFDFKINKPGDGMIQRNVSMSVSYSISESSSNATANVTNIEKFYITWFNEN